MALLPTWWENENTGYVVRGGFDDLPTRPEHKTHAYFAWDTMTLHMADNLRYWRTLPFPLPPTIDYEHRVPTGVSLIAGKTHISGKLSIQGKVKFI